MILNGFPWETNRDHSVIFVIASKYCISHSFVDCEAYSISFKGFLPTVVDIMVIYLMKDSSFQREGRSLVTSRPAETSYETSTGQVEGMQALQVP